MKPIETFQHKGLTVEIEIDQDCSSPRENCNLGTIVGFHRDYKLTDDGVSFDCPEAVMAHVKASGAIALPVYMYEHSGVMLSTGAFGCPWDSGQVGVIYVEREKVLKDYSVKRISPKVREKVLACLKAEVEEFSKYLNGECYGFVISRPKCCEACGNTSSDELDSCWGFIGFEYAKQSAIEAADGVLEVETRQAAEAATQSATE
jgi:hypothetical protein